MAFSLVKNEYSKKECSHLIGGESSQDSSTEFGDVNKRKGMRKSRIEGPNTRRIETSAPFDDGFLWRKYGTKKISSSIYPRSYFRCTYREEQNCPATKQVQQKDFTDPPVFLVTYSNSHSCNSKPMPDPKLLVRSGSNQWRPNLISFDFSEGTVGTHQLFSPLDSKFPENQLNWDQHVNFQFQNTTPEFTMVGSQTVNSQQDDALHSISLSDYSPLQELDELNGFDDFVLGDYLNSSDIN